MPTDLGDGVPRYSRREWGATGDGGSPGPKARGHVVEHTFAMDSPGPAASVDTEMAIMRSVDRYHQRVFSRHGIGYAEVTTDSARVYEGRGPKRWLAAVVGLNDTAYSFGHMGHGNKAPRAKGAWRAGRALHRWYRRKGWIAKLRYRLTGHRDHTDDKDCPGTLVSDADLEQLRPDATPPVDDGPDRRREEHAMRQGDTDDDFGARVVTDWQHFCNRFLYETHPLVVTHPDLRHVEAMDDLGGQVWQSEGVRGSNLNVDGEFGAKTRGASWQVIVRTGHILGHSVPGRGEHYGQDVITATVQALAATALDKYRRGDLAA